MEKKEVRSFRVYFPIEKFIELSNYATRKQQSKSNICIEALDRFFKEERKENEKVNNS